MKVFSKMHCFFQTFDIQFFLYFNFNINFLHFKAPDSNLSFVARFDENNFIRGHLLSSTNILGIFVIFKRIGINLYFFHFLNLFQLLLYISFLFLLLPLIFDLVFI